MRIAFIGCGNVGAPLADHLQKAGHEVTLATGDRGADSVAKAQARNAALKALSARDAVAAAEVVFLATPFGALEATLPPLSAELAGKVVVDCTNPVGPGISHGLKSERSGSAFVQSLIPGARVVKAFTIYGFENLEDPVYTGYGVKPAMLFCGDDAPAKEVVAGMIAQVGFEPVDVGGLEQALHLEHMTLLWVRMVRMKGQSPHLVWGALRRTR
jgi:8-hydroxy-5-deazaflavin:NADPH oxidoreductase